MDLWSHYPLFSAIVIPTFVYYYLTRNYNYWQNRGVPCIKGAVPGIGNILSLLLLRKNWGTLCTQFYDSAPQHSMVGFYFFRTPALLIRDPELVKSVLQTNFSSFAKNEVDVDEASEPLLYQYPFFSSGETWKIGRMRLASVFTGRKLKILSTIVTDVCQKFTDFLDRRITKNQSVYEFDAKSLFLRLTGEIVAVTGFGIQGHCFEDVARPHSFREITFPVFNGRFLNQVKTFLFMFWPWLLEVLKVKFLPRKFEAFFEKVSKSIVESRIEGQTGTDIAQWIMDQEMKETKDPEKLSKAVAAHLASLFVDAYDTLAIALAFAVYQLSRHVEIQEKVREEIRSALAKNHGNLTMETINEMPYMDQVINESSRHNTVLFTLTKVCTKRIELSGFDGLKCNVEPGTMVYIPVDGLHKDPQYWKNPMDFDPERFSPETVNARHKFVYLPFNEGPRNCPGRNIARIVMKMALSMILIKYSVELSPKMQIPLEYMAISNLTLTNAKHGLWIMIKPLCNDKVIP